MCYSEKATQGYAEWCGSSREGGWHAGVIPGRCCFRFHPIEGHVNVELLLNGHRLVRPLGLVSTGAALAEALGPNFPNLAGALGWAAKWVGFSACTAAQAMCCGVH